jgi:hypothetical protein
VGWYWNCSESISGRAENAREIERLAAQKELPPGSQLFAVYDYSGHRFWVAQRFQRYGKCSRITEGFSR